MGIIPNIRNIFYVFGQSLYRKKVTVVLTLKYKELTLFIDFIHDKPPLPKEDEPEPKRAKLDDIQIKEELEEECDEDEENIGDEEIPPEELESMLNDSVNIPKKTPDPVVPHSAYVKVSNTITKFKISEKKKLKILIYSSE